MSVPGKPWGMTVAGDELRVLLGQTDEDHRTIFRVVPGHGLRNSSAMPCPEDTGSHLSYDGDRLYVSQWYNRRIIALDATGKAGTIVDVPHQICGHTIVGGCFYCVTTDDENERRVLPHARRRARIGRPRRSIWRRSRSTRAASRSTANVSGPTTAKSTKRSPSRARIKHANSGVGLLRWRAGRRACLRRRPRPDRGCSSGRRGRAPSRGSARPAESSCPRS